MAAKTQPEKPLDETTKNRKVDRSKPSDANLASSKDGSPSDATSCISSGDVAGSIKEGDLDRESLVAEHGMYYPAGSYYGYYYPGYDGSLGEWDDQGYFIGSDGLEVQYPAIQADNGSLIYYTPVLQPGFVPYGSYLPGATVGIDGQYLGQQPYFPSPVFPQSIPSPGYFPNPVPFGSEVVSSYFWDPSLLVGDAGNGNGYGVPTITGSKPNLSSPAHNLASVSPKTLSTKTNNQAEIKASTPPLDVTSGAGVLNQLKPTNKVATALPKGYFPLAKLQGKSGLLYPNTPINFKANGRGWSGTEKLKSKTSGISDFDWLNEQNRGPRTNSTKVPVLEVDIAGTLTPDGNHHLDITAPVVRREQYNLPDFPTKYDHALFFVIKSYSEDDIHKSIKYNVWASTPNGNKRLDGAYLDAQERMGEKGNKCPVFLFFSVNASGQFCGVAEMIGRVDFNKNMDFWQQDKWNGYFPVKWHIIKDVPNPQFRHIILENNDNKPVTNSRDTQEVKFAQGIEMLNIFKNYSSKTSILDDFAFYESRQKAMQDKRIRPSTPRLDHVQKAGDITQVITGLQSIDLNAAKKSNEEVAVRDKAKD